NLDGPPSVLRNDTAAGHTRIQIKCVGVRSTRSAIGTRVTVTAAGRKQMAEVASGSSYYSHSDLRLHFGLGTASAGGAGEVAWAAGGRQTLKDLPVERPFVRR